MKTSLWCLTHKIRYLPYLTFLLHFLITYLPKIAQVDSIIKANCKSDRQVEDLTALELCVSMDGRFIYFFTRVRIYLSIYLFLTYLYLPYLGVSRNNSLSSEVWPLLAFCLNIRREVRFQLKNYVFLGLID